MLRRDFITLLGSAAIARPLSVLAEQGKVAKIGVLLLGYPDPLLFIKGFRKGLRDLGYEEGRSIELIIREISDQLLGKRRMNEQSIRFPLRNTRKIGFELTGF